MFHQHVGMSHYSEGIIHHIPTSLLTAIIQLMNLSLFVILSTMEHPFPQVWAVTAVFLFAVSVRQ